MLSSKLDRRAVSSMIVVILLSFIWLTQTSTDALGIDAVALEQPAFAFSADGRLLASSRNSDAVALIDLANGEQRTLEPQLLASAITTTGLSFTPDGAMLAVADLTGISLWDLASGERRAVLNGPFDGAVTDLTFSENGQVLVGRLGESQILIWDMVKRLQRRIVPSDGSVMDIALSPDGSRLASRTTDAKLQLWDVGSGEALAVPGLDPDAPITSLVFAPDGAVLIGGDQNGTITLWDLDAGTRKALDDSRDIEDLAISPDGKLIAGRQLDGRLRVWESATAGARAAFLAEIGAGAPAPKFSSASDLIAFVDGDDLIQVWDLRTGRVSQALLGHAEAVVAMAFVADDQALASLSRDGELIVWDLSAGTEQSVVYLSGFDALSGGQSAQVSSANGSDRANALASATQARGVLADGQAVNDSQASAPAGEPAVDQRDAKRRGHQWQGLTSLAVSVDGKRVVSTDESGAVRFWDGGLNERSAVKSAISAPATGVAFTADGRRFVSVGSDTSVRWWDADSGSQTQRRFGHEHPIRAVAASPTDRLVVTAGEETRIMVWNADTGRLEKILNRHRDFVNALAFSADGKMLASAGADGSVLLWTPASGDLLRTLSAHTGAVNAVAFSKDGGVLASAGADSVVKLWDGASGKLIASLAGHRGGVRALAFSSTDASLLVSAGEDARIRLWNTRTGKLIGTSAVGAAAINALVFLPNGQLLSSDEAGAITVWSPDQLNKIKSLQPRMSPRVLQDELSGSAQAVEGASMAVTATVFHGDMRVTGMPPVSSDNVFGGFFDRVLDWLVPSAAAAVPTGINQGSGGPILVVTPLLDTLSPAFGTYYAEILRTEGLNAFRVEDVADNPLTAATLAGYDVVILAPTSLTSAQVAALTDWVDAGGNLIAMRPDPQLYPLLGIASQASTLDNGYLLVNTSAAPGNGIVGESIQFHGSADRYTAGSASTVATLYSDATTATTSPAVTLRAVGDNGGQSAAFAFDLAESIVYTRQGNPAWAAEERDGFVPIRSNDKFFGDAASDPQPDWIDFDKVAIPQADELQRFLANLILEMNRNRKPLPRFWYLPRGEKAVVIMTGDDHANNGTAGRFDQFIAASPPGCSLPDWECVRGTSYIFPNEFLTDAVAAAYDAQGFEVGVHINTGCPNDFTEAQLELAYASQIGNFSTTYPSLPAPITQRHHCIVWSDWASAAKLQFDYGMRLDTTYYFWPPSWVLDRPGFFNGSAMPMRFADLDGTLIDVYNAQTQMTDESGQSYPDTIDTLLNNALGAEGYYGAMTINAHTDLAQIPESDAVVASALARDVPIITARQMLDWLDGRNSSSFNAISWSGNALSFSVTQGPGANGLQALLPMSAAGGGLTGMMRNGAGVAYTTETTKGIVYARFSAEAGDYVASYASDTSAPTLTSRFPAGGATNVALTTAVTATFSEALDPATLTATTFELRAGATSVPAVPNYDFGTDTATLSLTSALTPATVYTATVRGGSSGVKDLAGNPLAADVSWSFTTSDAPVGCATGSTLWADTATPSVAASADGSAIEIGVKFRPNVDGFICGVRFYKGTGNTGAHVGNLWTATGTLLATAAFSEETATGWQQVDFASPVPVNANTLYIASYHAPAGRYAADASYFGTNGVANGPLYALRDGESGGNGVYLYGPGGFPSNSFGSSNYWVDVVFTTATAGPDTTAPTLTSRTPTVAATDVASGSTVTATFSEALAPATVNATNVRLANGGTPVPATVSYNAASNTATLTPSAPLDASTGYTVTLVGGSGGITDLAGNPLAADITWSFTTGTATLGCSTGTTLWSATTTPTLAAAADTSAVELGVKFRPSANGFICGVRFYKGAGNTGAHVGNLWSATGTLLATAVFSEETVTGWQQVDFPTPVAVSANTLYVASYHAPAGRYAIDNRYFSTSGVTNGPLYALRSGESGGNGVYLYGSGGFPSNSFQSSNYWVDAVFTTATAGPDTTAPTLTNRTPAVAATDVASGSAVTATFSEALAPATVNATNVRLANGGTPVPATVSYNAASNTATLTPSAPLDASTGYTVTLVGGSGGITDLAGNPLAANVTWSFTTGTVSNVCTSPANPVVAENCLPGAPPSEWEVNGAGDLSIQGFATDISVDRGETVSFKIDTDAADYRLDIYRMGYYAGNGARKVATVQPSAPLPQSQPVCLANATGLLDCGNWSLSASWDVPTDAVSGIYFAKAIREDTSGASHIVFIVRDDSSTSDILFQTSDTTWQAYNTYGGNSFYTGSGPGTGGDADGRAYKISYNRPFVTRAVDNGQDWVFNAEYPMVRWLEANGYDATYFTGVDSDRRGERILDHGVFLSVGHDEYWSDGQRQAVEAARDAGVHLAFFSGNEVFWKTRWENSIDGSGAPYRTLVCYKETHAGAKIDPTASWTGTWRDPRFSPPADGGLPENALTGTLFTVNDGANGSIEVPAADGKMRFWRNTNIATLGPGQTATLPFETLGYEWDEDIDNGFRPPGSIRLSSTTVQNAPVLLDYGSTFGPGTATHSLTLSKRGSGALVFGAGTVQWSWGLDDNHDRGAAPPDARMRQATVNLLADMGAQPGSLQPGLIAATASADTVAPSSTIVSLSDGAVLPLGVPVTVSGTASDAGGGVVGGVEVSVDGGSTWHPAVGRDTWSYSWIPGAQGPVTIRTRAADDSVNLESPTAGVTVTVDAAPPSSCSGDSIWPPTAVPILASDPETSGVEIGVKFRPSANGFVCGVRFYKGAGNTGTHVGNLWSATGTLLATATFTSETATGWQQVEFPAPVAVSANTVYVASYHAPVGRYASDSGFFATSGVTNGPLYALRDGESGGNGVYLYGSGGFPTNSFESSNYWVDVVFTTDTGGPDTTAPTLTNRTPAVAATDVAPASAVTATFSEALAPAAVNATNFRLANGAVPILATVSYNAATNTATLIPSAPLVASTSYTVTLVGGSGGITDLEGNALAADITWSFTTGAAPVGCAPGSTLWAETDAPILASDPETSAVEIGVKFRPNVNGFICGMRFYKSAANTGTHVGNLWSATGTLLATATFTSETATGWQQVDFPAPVAVSANTLYVASYHAPAGRYAIDSGFFATSGVTSGPLYALRDGESGGNGVYRYGAGGFPVNSFESSNYWVDVVFTTNSVPASAANSQ